jgi:hypothetical protein
MHNMDGCTSCMHLVRLVRPVTRTNKKLELDSELAGCMYPYTIRLPASRRHSGISQLSAHLSPEPLLATYLLHVPPASSSMRSAPARTHMHARGLALPLSSWSTSGPPVPLPPQACRMMEARRPHAAALQSVDTPTAELLFWSTAADVKATSLQHRPVLNLTVFSARLSRPPASRGAKGEHA